MPHGDNWKPTVKDQLITSWRECAQTAANHGIYISLEGHQVAVLDNAQTTREVVDAVDSGWVRSDLDSANRITLKTVMETLNLTYLLIIEGASAEQLPATSQFLHQTAADPGITVRDKS